MSRTAVVAAAQMGPIERDEPRQSTVARMVSMMRQAKERGANLIVFPELALTTFFPRYWMENEVDVDAFFERDMPGPATQPLFDEAAKLGVGFYLGYAELAEEKGRTRHFNSSIIVDRKGNIAGKYRKVHLPGHHEYESWRPFQHLEKAYFEPGNLGFPVFNTMEGIMGMCICNDRRWPETYRCMGLQDVEIIMLGYNTPRHFPQAPEVDRLQDFHNHLSLQAGAYQNGSWVIGVAKAGVEDGCELIGQSVIVAPTGEIVAMTSTMGDEIIVAECDLDRAARARKARWNWDYNREPRHYGIIVDGPGRSAPAND
jgi:predicted amidohydrolase